MQTYSEIFWSGLCTSGKKKKAKQDRHYCSFCDRVCQHPLTRGTPVNVTRSPHTGTGRAQTQLGSSKAVIRRAPAAHNLPVLLSSVLQQSPGSTGSSWVKKQLFTEHWAVALSCPWLVAQTQPGWAGGAEPGLPLQAGTVTGAAVSSHPSATSLSCCQLLNLLSKNRKGLLKFANALEFTVLCSGMSSLLVQGLNQVTSTNILKINFAACNKVHLLNTIAFPPNLYAAFYENFSFSFSFKPETWEIKEVNIIVPIH